MSFEVELQQFAMQNIEQRLQKCHEHRTDQNPNRPECIDAPKDAQECCSNGCKRDLPCSTSGLMRLSTLDTTATP